MSVKSYSNNAAYYAASVPTDESRVARIEDTNEVKIDGVNVLMDMPTDVCAAFEDAYGNPKFVRWDTINSSLISDDWTHVGYSFDCQGKKVSILDKTFPTTTYQWLSVWQYAITAISSTSITISLRMKGDYANYVVVSVSLTSAAINSTTVSEINTALEAAGNTDNVGYEKHGYWAYLADDDYNMVDDESDATMIIVQCDLSESYNQYRVSGSGCTIALCVWRDMPASSVLWRRNGKSSSYGGMNLAKFIDYYDGSGTTPSSDVDMYVEKPVTLDAFTNSDYCATLRSAYGTYEEYMKANMVMLPHPKYGAFELIDAVEMTELYGNVTAPLKDDSTVYVFPALHYGATVGYGSGIFATGNWHLQDVNEGSIFLEDSVLAKLAEAQDRMGTTVIANSVSRWFARRYSTGNAWYYYGYGGYLGGNGVTNATRCQAVTLLDLE